MGGGLIKKLYYNYLNEIDSNELYEGLLAFGLFSEKLPPVFTSKAFFDYCQAHNPIFSKVPMQYIYYESMRNINIPRPFGIPTPATYQLLCRCLADNWDTLKLHFENQTIGHQYKVSRIHIRKIQSSKSLFEMNYKNFRTDDTPELDLLIGKRYLACADVSNCFPSIYTHSLSWALVGKDIAKQTQGDRRKWYNVIDFYTRNIKDGETHGLPIGPHTSNLLSEVILTVIDKDLYDKGYRYIRNIDDYTCYVATYEEGQAFLVELASQLRHYDLTLNYKKTEIVELPIAAVENWVRRINDFSTLNKSPKMKFNEVRAYLDFSVELMRDNQMNAAILNYAIKVLSKKTMNENAKECCVKTIFHLALIFPYIIPLLDDYVFIPYSVKKEDIQKLSNKIYSENKKNQNYEAVSFSLFFSLKYGFKIDNVTFNDAKQSNHCIFMLMAYLNCVKYEPKSVQKEYRKYAEQLSKSKDDFNKNWLFVYEVLPQNTLKDYWKSMKKNHVSFIASI